MKISWKYLVAATFLAIGLDCIHNFYWAKNWVYVFSEPLTIEEIKEKNPEIMIFHDKSERRVKWCAISSFSFIPIPFFSWDSAVIRNESGDVYGYYGGDLRYKGICRAKVNFAALSVERKQCATMKEELDREMEYSGFRVLKYCDKNRGREK